MNLYNDSGGEISEEDALKMVAERHPIIREIGKTLERGGIGR
jgi:hypothetical protein